MSDRDHDHRECVAMFKKLSEYIDNELDPVTCDDIKRHAEKCMPCKSCLETLRQTVNLCRTVKDQPVSEEFSLRLKDAISRMTARAGCK